VAERFRLSSSQILAGMCSDNGDLGRSMFRRSWFDSSRRIQIVKLRTMKRRSRKHARKWADNMGKEQVIRLLSFKSCVTCFQDFKMLKVESFALGPLETNAYLLLDPESNKAVIIDPGMNPERLIERIKD